MTSELRYKISIRCDRTGRETTKMLTLDAAQQTLLDERVRARNATKIQEFILKLEGPLPDLVVFCDDKLVVLNTVVDKTGKSILRLLHALTRSTLFPEPARRARNKKMKQTG